MAICFLFPIKDSLPLKLIFYRITIENYGLNEIVLKSLGNCMEAEPSEVEVKLFTFGIGNYFNDFKSFFCIDMIGQMFSAG